MFAHVLARLWERPDAITKEMPSHCGGEEKANVHFLCQLISGRALCHCHARATVFSLYLSLLISWVFFVQNGKSVIAISFWNLKEIQCTVERGLTTRHFHWKHFPALSLEPVLSQSTRASARCSAVVRERKPTVLQYSFLKTRRDAAEPRHARTPHRTRADVLHAFLLQEGILATVLLLNLLSTTQWRATVLIGFYCFCDNGRVKEMYM